MLTCAAVSPVSCSNPDSGMVCTLLLLCLSKCTVLDGRPSYPVNSILHTSEALKILMPTSKESSLLRS